MNTHRPRLTDAATNQGAPMVTKHLSRTHSDGGRLAAAAQHLYDAECALHIAHQSHVDPWIAAAGERLHEALAEHVAATAAAVRVEGTDVTAKTHAAACAEGGVPRGWETHAPVAGAKSP
jgi:hypothetical protein